MTEILHNAAAAVDAPQAPESEQRPARPLTQRAKDYFIRTPSLWTFAVLIVLVVVFSVSSHGEFGTASNIKNILVDASLLMIVSVGMTLTIIAGGIDLSVGAVTIFTSVFAGLIMGDIGGNGVVPVLVGLVAGVGTGLAWGLINGTIVSYMGVAPLIATLGSLGMATGLALVISGGTDIATVPSLLTNIGNGSVIGVPYLVLIALAVALAGGIYLNGTRRGLYLYAIGSNREAATRTGVHVRKNLRSCTRSSAGSRASPATSHSVCTRPVTWPATRPTTSRRSRPSSSEAPACSEGEAGLAAPLPVS